ncbi:tetratricopeptide repeat protein [Parabacteroides sp. FAFU027]|uniref:tetratricopeptide repeat protein n=1 Tax=Parabacteroides sp. FAFU027 TaxID=2922715 RepID=UPI001FAECFDD|nr:tetratricopeptide repeat protein [Parabacteroides sp. FAFU027]
MKKFFLLPLACISICAFEANAQAKDTIPASGNEIIKKGIELNDNGKYDEAIRMFGRVSPCDPDYAWACYETALTYSNSDKAEPAYLKCLEAESLNPNDPNTATLKGNLLDDMGKTGEAIQWLNAAYKRWPYNQRLIFNLAVCYLNNNDPQKAEELLITGLKYNPYHSSSHMALAKANYIMGRKAQAFLAYNMGVLLNTSNRNISSFEKAVTGENDSISHPYQYSYPKDLKHEKWDELTGLLNSELAFKNDFPYNFKINYITTRQSLMLFRKMAFEGNDPSFYNQCYVRFFADLMKENDFETYTYYFFQNTEDKTVTDWIKKNKKQYDRFVARSKQKLNNWREYGFSTDNEQKQIKQYHFDDNGDLESLGMLKEGNKPSKEGHWVVVNDEGGRSEEGVYKEDKIEGKWLLFWEQGPVKQDLNYKNDELDGQNITYHPNGVKSGIYPRLNGKREGMEEEYTSCGKLLFRHPYKNDKSEGTLLEVEYGDGLQRETAYKNGKKEGPCTEKWLSGGLKTEAFYKDSLLEGSVKRWYANGKPESVFNHKADKATGKFVTYHANGVKKLEGEYDESGELTGTYREYDRNGKLLSLSESYKAGKLTGVQTFYFPDGAKQGILNYKEDEIMQLEWFDKSGKKLYAATNQNGELPFKSYYPDGSLRQEGVYRKGKKEGNWKTYTPAGVVLEEENWKDGMQSGSQKGYFYDGSIKTAYSCDSNRVVGPYNLYYANGHLRAHGYYDKEGYTGESLSYYSNDSLQSRGFYKDNHLVGRRMSYSPSGKLLLEERFNRNGEQTEEIYFDLQGKVSDDLKFEYDSLNYIQHYPNGKVKAKISICDNERNGIQETYYPNGKLKSRQHYLFGKEQGLSTNWDYHGVKSDEQNYIMNEPEGVHYSFENGKPDFKTIYENGKEQGLYQEFYPNGKVFRQINFEDGERQGNTDYFAPDSTWMFSLHYFKQNLTGISYRDNKNNLLKEQPISQFNSDLLCYYPNGKLSAKVPLKKGIFDGVNVNYYPNGNVMRERTFVNDALNGTNKYYYASGKLKETSEYRNDNRNGHYVSYFENGQKEMEGEYLADKKSGKWLVYDKTGKLTETLFYENDEIYDIR